jgi:hypothetical protein
MRCRACNKLLSDSEIRYIDYIGSKFSSMQFDDLCYTCLQISTDPDRAEMYDQGLEEVMYDEYFEPSRGAGGDE